MRFTKMHGLGNDFVVIDTVTDHVADAGALARTVSQRGYGVGADGLILILPSRAADVGMAVHNADGSKARMCGNGIRCVAKYAVDHGIAKGPLLRIETDSGVVGARCRIVHNRVMSIRIDMGSPSLNPADLPTSIPSDRIVDYSLRVGEASYTLTTVSMGNPHAVVFVDDWDGIDLDTVGPRFENASEFPERINAHFVRVDSRTHVSVKTWERGSGATRACGTGACAVCVAGAVTGRTDRSIMAALPGGELEIEWSGDDHVHMTGPAVEVYSGDLASGSEEQAARIGSISD